MAQSESGQPSDADTDRDLVAGSGPGGVPPGTAALIKRWREKSEGGPDLPEPEARRVVEAVLDDLRGTHPENLQIAGRLWGQSYRSVSEMVESLSQLRGALASSGVEDPLKMHRALDKVTAAASEELIARLERVSRTDALTGVGNRRAFDETIHATLSAASRQGHDVTVVVVDLDGLKRINDTAGHAAGDAALIAVVRAFYDALRDEDLIFRLGGDEFVILLPFTSVDVAGALMRRVAATDAPAFTWGAAGYPGDGSDAGALVDAADRDLYRRRGVVRGTTQAPKRVGVISARLEGVSRLSRWAWLPAAAVLVFSLVATLVSASSPGHVLAQKGSRSTSTTSPTGPGRNRGGSGSSGGQGQGQSPGTSPATSSSGGTGGANVGGSTSTPAQTVGYTPPSSTGGGAGSSGSGGGSGSGSSGGGGGASDGGGGGGGTSPPSPPGGSSPSGGVVGVVDTLLGPLPLLGNNGLLPVVDQLLVGQPPTAAGTVQEAAVSDPTQSAGPLRGSGAPVLSGGSTQSTGSVGGLFSLLAGL